MLLKLILLISGVVNMTSLAILLFNSVDLVKDKGKKEALSNILFIFMLSQVILLGILVSVFKV